MDLALVALVILSLGCIGVGVALIFPHKKKRRFPFRHVAWAVTVVFALVCQTVFFTLSYQAGTSWWAAYWDDLLLLASLGALFLSSIISLATLMGDLKRRKRSSRTTEQAVEDEPKEESKEKPKEQAPRKGKETEEALSVFGKLSKKGREERG